MLVVVAEVAEEEKMLSTFQCCLFWQPTHSGWKGQPLQTTPSIEQRHHRHCWPQFEEEQKIVFPFCNMDTCNEMLDGKWYLTPKTLICWHLQQMTLNSGLYESQSNFSRIDNAYKTSYYRLNRCCGTVHAAWIAAVTLSVPRSKRLMY